MAHTKAQGAANRTVNVEGKRLGIKRYAGEKINTGTIIVRQKGTKFHTGINTKMGRDFTIFASADGIVSFRNMTGHHRGQKYIDVTPEVAKTKVAKVAKTAKSVKTSAKPTAKKVAAKKVATKKVVAKKTPATKKVVIKKATTK